jgi:hypothetical protein
VPPKPHPAPPAPAPAPAVAPQGSSWQPKQVRVTESIRRGNAGSNGYPSLGDGRPDFGKMDVDQRLAYHRQRLGLGR